MYNNNHQSDSKRASPFVHKEAQKLPNLLRCCG